MQPMKPNNGIIFFFTAIFHFLFLSHQYLVELLKTWFRRIAAFLDYFHYLKRSMRFSAKKWRI